ncbi:hypothetical protein EDB87DRAFT_570996 [Lactarius vividus]|nr:hypothetical protein EDB87DRAFT_570996 [Lactarius vividus]
MDMNTKIHFTGEFLPRYCWYLYAFVEYRCRYHGAVSTTVEENLPKTTDSPLGDLNTQIRPLRYADSDIRMWSNWRWSPIVVMARDSQPRIVPKSIWGHVSLECGQGSPTPDETYRFGGAPCEDMFHCFRLVGGGTPSLVAEVWYVFPEVT